MSKRGQPTLVTGPSSDIGSKVFDRLPAKEPTVHETAYETYRPRKLTRCAVANVRAGPADPTLVQSALGNPDIATVNKAAGVSQWVTYRCVRTFGL